MKMKYGWLPLIALIVPRLHSLKNPIQYFCSTLLLNYSQNKLCMAVPLSVVNLRQRLFLTNQSEAALAQGLIIIHKLHHLFIWAVPQTVQMFWRCLFGQNLLFHPLRYFITSKSATVYMSSTCPPTPQKKLVCKAFLVGKQEAGERIISGRILPAWTRGSCLT